MYSLKVPSSKNMTMRSIFFDKPDVTSAFLGMDSLIAEVGGEAFFEIGLL